MFEKKKKKKSRICFEVFHYTGWWYGVQQALLFCEGAIRTCFSFFIIGCYITSWYKCLFRRFFGWAFAPISKRPSSQPSWPPPKDRDNTFHFKGSTKTSQQNARRNPHCSTAPSQIHIKFEKKKKSRRTSFESFVVTNFERDEKPHMYMSYEAVHIPGLWYCPAPSSYGSFTLSVNP